ncbi:hypothetical protein OEZ60_20525 [Defluviimonas sp. WL0024]|uniref:Uncharacterized protein n=1 Tax=Albidovulum salinarum TaxID=2984153 RepID=A0ABT2XAD3_9RHOB|nr:hypothetical protein [Defluviimonas sp. WL0024]MCU9850374.1 hypothetical protein [Defluviimonas sp. WL0024]
MSRWTEDEMLELAARGVGKVDRDGLRGATLVSMEEIAAMAGALAALGLPAIHPGAYTPPNKIRYTEGERA